MREETHRHTPAQIQSDIITHTHIYSMYIAHANTQTHIYTHTGAHLVQFPSTSDGGKQHFFST